MKRLLTLVTTCCGRSPDRAAGLTAGLPILGPGFIVAALIALSPAPVRAQGVLIVTDPEVIVPLPRPIPFPTPQPPVSTYRIKELAVQAAIRDQVAQVQVSQVFVNTGRTTMEVEFCFPLPYDGAIDRLTLMVDGKEYPARLLPAGEARALYESIVRKNRDPALLEWIGNGMFRTSVFPVPPGQERQVTLKYTQLLRSSQQLADFLFPLSTAKYTSQPVESVQFRVSVETTTADLKSIYSPTHSVQVERPDARHAVVTYSAANTIPDSDFRLFYDVAAGPVGASVLSYRPTETDEGYFLLLAAPQFAAADGAPVSKNIVFVLDRSGSMEGQKIEQAREALAFVLNNLRDGDRFNIVVYDSSVETFRPELQTFNQETRAAAIGFVNGIYAGGGTNIGGALSTGLTQFKDVQGPSYLLFLTDGLPTVGETSESKLVAASKQANPGKVRMINFGVGYDVNSRLLDRLSRAHHGQSEYVRPEEDLEVHVSRLYKKISAPVMTDVAVTIEFDAPTSAELGATVNRIYPRTVPDLFAGEQLVLVGRYKPTGRAKVTLTGNVAGKPRSFDFPAEFTAATDTSHAFVEKLWAMRRIGEIIDDIDLNGKHDELVKELVALSTKHGILTPYTSFLADESGRELAEVERLNQAGEAVDNLSVADGRGGFRQREFKQMLQLGNTPSRRSGRFYEGVQAPALSGDVTLRALDTDEAIDVSGIKTVGNETLYRRGKLFMTAGTESLDLERDKDQIITIERFSPEYFRLVAANTAAENTLLSSQQADEELLVTFRGQAYYIK